MKNSKFANVTKNQIETLILPFIPKNRRGFAPKVDLAEIVQCILYKLKTGVQWHSLFVDIKGFIPLLAVGLLLLSQMVSNWDF